MFKMCSVASLYSPATNPSYEYGWKPVTHLANRVESNVSVRGAREFLWLLAKVIDTATGALGTLCYNPQAFLLNNLKKRSVQKTSWNKTAMITWSLIGLAGVSLFFLSRKYSFHFLKDLNGKVESKGNFFERIHEVVNKIFPKLPFLISFGSIGASIYFALNKSAGGKTAYLAKEYSDQIKNRNKNEDAPFAEQVILDYDPFFAAHLENNPKTKPMEFFQWLLNHSLEYCNSKQLIELSDEKITKFSAHWPIFFSNVSALRLTCKLEKIPEEILGFKKLKGLEFKNCGFKEITKEDWKVVNKLKVNELLSLFLDKSLIKFESPDEPLMNLTQLEINGDRATSNFLKNFDFSKFPNLNILSITGCCLDEIPPSVFQLKKLEELRCDDNNITDISSLKKLENLKGFFASNNKITKVQGIAQLKDLRCVELFRNPLDLSDIGIGELNRFSSNCYS
jgi:hypothetical protein